ncbi:hypothetical protein O3M35_004937 [Rhynocoris fuscipes]|uniref:Uncharacterized protein n=1 Tax=Rhynocoris fuscipes TaxID=488301 RepID=A0AAW1DP03_9HEMI
MKLGLLLLLFLSALCLCLASQGQGIDEEKIYPDDTDEIENEDFNDDFIDPEPFDESW